MAATLISPFKRSCNKFLCSSFVSALGEILEILDLIRRSVSTNLLCFDSKGTLGLLTAVRTRFAYDCHRTSVSRLSIDCLYNGRVYMARWDPDFHLAREWQLTSIAHLIW